MQALAGPPRLKPFELVEEAVMRFLETHDGGVSHRRAPKPSAPSVLERGPAEQLIDRWRPTTWFDLRIGRAAQRVRLEGFTPSRSLALFSTQAEPPLVSMSHESLVACLCHAWISPVEPVPMIARAFRTVLSDLKRTAQAASEGGHPGG
jgi:hypothetical protein